MAFPPGGYNNNPGAGHLNGMSRGSGSGATISLALDNMLRNQLKVSDPRNATQVAEGLLAYYQDLPQAAGIRQEALGLPFLQGPATVAPQAMAAPSSSDAEYAIANGDVEKALQDLANNPLTNDITPEMRGWGDSIRTAIVQGHAAARQGLDPTQRDKVISVRRQLGEYARMARFVGSLTAEMTQNYRRLGRGLDEVSAVLLVMLGESLASIGFASGYYLLQVPLQELQQRRDAVIYALRNFNGGAQQSYGPDDWPRGIDAYRRLYKWLEDQGQGDLRSLLQENEVARTMDVLITRGQNGTPEGLRALGVTAQLDIERFRRLVIVAPGAMANEHGHFDRSPPLEAYLQALELFAETFKPAGGLRLLRIARPPILLYGLYSTNQLERDNSLFNLISARGTLATIFDGLFPSNSRRGVQPQVLLDMLLFELDRGIDLLALGSGITEDGPTERRAIALWAIVRVILYSLAPNYYPAASPLAYNYNKGPMTIGYMPTHLAGLQGDYESAILGVPRLTETFDNYVGIKLTQVPTLLSPHQKIAVAEELRVQLSLEDRWENLVHTIAPEAGDQQSVFMLLKTVVEQAAHDVLATQALPRAVVPLPPQFEQSLAMIARKP
jgi:hypothetical protein